MIIMIFPMDAECHFFFFWFYFVYFFLDSSLYIAVIRILVDDFTLHALEVEHTSLDWMVNMQGAALTNKSHSKFLEKNRTKHK